MSKDSSIGAIWKKAGQYGEYLSISIEIEGKKYNYTAFANKFKQEGDLKPDFKIMPPRSQNKTTDKVSTMEDRIAFVNAEKSKYKQNSAASKQESFISEEDVPF